MKIEEFFAGGPARRVKRTPPKDYADAVRLSRAEGRGESIDQGSVRWIAGDFRRGTFRTRRDALRACPAGTRPLRVIVRDRLPGERRP